MRDKNHRHFPFQPVDRLRKMLRCHLIKVGHRFIEDQNLRPLEQRSGNRNPLEVKGVSFIKFSPSRNSIISISSKPEIHLPIARHGAIHGIPHRPPALARVTSHPGPGADRLGEALVADGHPEL